MTKDLFYMIVITYAFLIISFLLNIFYHKLSMKKSLFSAFIQIFVMNSAILFMLSEVIEPKELVMWQLPFCLVIMILAQIFDKEELKFLRLPQNRIVLSLIFIYVVMDILRFNDYIKNFIYFVAFALAELFLFGILQKAYKKTKEKIEDKKKERQMEDDDEDGEEDTKTKTYVDFRIDETSLAKDEPAKEKAGEVIVENTSGEEVVEETKEEKNE